MSYTIKEDEFALVIKPVLDDDGEWDGEIAAGITMGENKLVPLEIQRHMISVITLLNAFLAYAEDNPAVLEEVEEYRDELLRSTLGTDVDTDIPDKVEKPSNVIKLNRFTKTVGNA